VSELLPYEQIPEMRRSVHRDVAVKRSKQLGLRIRPILMDPVETGQLLSSWMTKGGMDSCIKLKATFGSTLPQVASISDNDKYTVLQKEKQRNNAGKVFKQVRGGLPLATLAAIQSQHLPRPGG
jgi:hypothetical protein